MLRMRKSFSLIGWIEKDKLNLVISEKDKAILSQMSSVTIDSNLSSDINDENLQIFRATLDIPEV